MQQVTAIVVDHANCPVRDVLDRVGDKWSILVPGAAGGFVTQTSPSATSASGNTGHEFGMKSCRQASLNAPTTATLRSSAA
jgi:hypothetical protein